MEFSRFPSLYDKHTKLSVALESEKLMLPSSFNQAECTSLGLDAIACVEFELQKGQVHDALAALHLKIKTFNANLAFKIAFVHYQRANT